VGMYIEHSVNSTIQTCSFLENNGGLEIQSPINFTILFSSFDYNGRGFTGLNGRNSSVLDCSFADNVDWGIQVSSFELMGWNITRNTIEGGWKFGIGLFTGLGYNITHNTITGCEVGIYLEDIEQSTISHNNVSHGEFGIYADGITECAIFENTFYWNGERGIYIDDGTLCTLYGNSLGGNGINAWDSGSNNQWNNSLGTGNKWSDYSGTGTYSIPGEAGSVDYYPESLSDTDPPVISSPPDVSLDILIESYYVTWEVSDLGLNKYRILRNGTQVAEDDVEDWSISYDVGGLDAGVYNFTIFVNDTAGNEAWDTVIVTVTSAIGFIRITSNADFVTYGFPGTGIEGDPYRIENRTIIGDSTCIVIQDTTAYFVIRNCVLISQSSQAGFGVWLQNVTNGTVEDCTIHMKIGSIYAEASPYNVFHNNTISLSKSGIHIVDSMNTTITDNDISDIAPLPESMPLLSDSGIGLSNSANSTIAGNTIRNATHFGLVTSNCVNVAVRDNEFESCGFINLVSFGSDYNITVTDNIVNGKPLAYLENEAEQQLDADDYGQIHLFNCTKISILNGDISDSTVGIELVASENTTIENVTLGFNSYGGVLGLASFNVSMVNCTAYGSYMGTMFQFCGGVVYNSTFACNRMVGIAFALADFEVRDCQIFGNLGCGI
ncbi:MAG: right-handed parallel beta-helix repeat-containing protein, partial [Candidatus Thorarchaeota archaeon]|nr:right-handed parallel beta-helix repeat-containing protein [Candidatus Thorarchaeota archaeon]